MASGTFYPGASGDDGCWTAGGATFLGTADELTVYKTTSNDYWLFCKFKSVPIPQGSTITAAFIRFTAYQTESDIAEAIKLLESSKAYDGDQELKDYTENSKKKGMIGSRIISLAMSALFFAIANLPMKESFSIMKYVLLGASLFFVLIFIFSFRWGVEN